ncbi:O-antigen ligase family protein [Planococcus donghaensis]|uniref:O-antigen ligase family protein n=1 Tax=Planococcus donghaensis TaxID=414778 RepID=UPI003736A860
MKSEVNGSIDMKVYILPKIAVILLAIYVLEGYMLTNANPLLGLSILMLTIHILSRKNVEISIKKSHMLWISFSIVLIAGSSLSVNINEGLKFGFYIFGLVVTMIILSNSNNWQNSFYKAVWFFSLIHVVATLLAFAFPYWISGVSSFLLNSVDFELNQYFIFQYGGNPGITGQIGLNAWFISIFIATAFSSVITSSKRKWINSLLLFLALFALLLANKRGLIIGNLIAILVISSSLGFFNKKALKRIIPTLFLISGLIGVIIAYVPEAQVVINRFNQTSNFLTGRESIYQDMFTYFSENPILGVGTFSIVKLVGEAGHNVYLQVLAENGLLGFLLLMSAIVVSLLNTFRNLYYLRKNENRKKKKVLIFSLYIQILFIIYSLSGNPLYNYQFISIYLFAISTEISVINKKTIAKSEA